MTILSFIKLFPGYTLQLSFNHLNNDGTLDYDEEYSYWGAADKFSTRMIEYSWIFEIELTDIEVTSITINKHTRTCAIYIEQYRGG